ncbi:uncharacterized protein LOC132729760 [Ruditapes philippinarum]|uniref:uncharacterized protein LOC132729760 n=1 Tax=Ruditapes philippinarum TaxID=129788 RepID=UPI00295ACF6B|nr:uncharacterized protein LOC132729760 [Ruditapes philippinarum]
MDKSLDKGPTAADFEELTILLQNRAFVDYLNIFLCLHVFGQHVLYNFLELEFEFEPPIKNRRHLYMDKREVLRWLCVAERMPKFKKSGLYTEYCLCVLLLDSKFELAGVNLEST